MSNQRKFHLHQIHSPPHTHKPAQTYCAVHNLFIAITVSKFIFFGKHEILVVHDASIFLQVCVFWRLIVIVTEWVYAKSNNGSRQVRKGTTFTLWSVNHSEKTNKTTMNFSHWAPGLNATVGSMKFICSLKCQNPNIFVLWNLDFGILGSICLRSGYQFDTDQSEWFIINSFLCLRKIFAMWSIEKLYQMT